MSCNHMYRIFIPGVYRKLKHHRKYISIIKMNVNFTISNAFSHPTSLSSLFWFNFCHRKVHLCSDYRCVLPIAFPLPMDTRNKLL